MTKEDTNNEEEISDLDKKGVEILIKLVKKRMNGIKGSDKHKEEYIILEQYLEGYEALRGGGIAEGYKIAGKEEKEGEA